MARALTAAMAAEIVTAGTRPFLLVALDFPSAALRLTTREGDVSFNGQVFLGDGVPLDVSAIEETTDAGPAGIAVSLAATAALRATVTTDFFQGRRAAVWLGFIDDAGAVVPAPAPIVGGFMEGADFDDDPARPSIGLRIENRLRDMTIARERRWSNEDQQVEFPGDTGLRYVEAIQDFALRAGTL